MAPSVSSVAFFGPTGTFTEEALLTQADLASAALIPKGSIAEVLDAVSSGETEVGFVPIENGIEGPVNETIDGLIFSDDLLIVREVVLDIHLQLMARPGTRIQDVNRVHSFPHALAQCRGFLSRERPDAMPIAATSTADAARWVGEEGGPHDAAIAPRLSATLYGLEIIADDIEDHLENQTRFVAVARGPIPVATGHDHTSIVCFQDADRPGSLYGMLGQFAARDINLTSVHSRPSKRGLGEYCFVIDFEGHLGEDVVSDCLRDLRVHVANVKFLGSYPALGEPDSATRKSVTEARLSANDWIGHLRSQLEQ
ncbi:MAG: prephenate dehydratase [Actinomycetes bacterium]